MEDYDFSGWATKCNILCSDGRTIMKDAFKHNDGKVVPLVWNHQHNSPDNVLGHALLQSRDEGMYTYCSFNDTDEGVRGKRLVEHGDIVALSIFANQLKQNGGNVMHGEIREVSLVYAGANPGAYIDSVMAHGFESEEEAIIYNDGNIELYHSDKGTNSMEKTKETQNTGDQTVVEVFQNIMGKLDDTEQKVLYAIIGSAYEAQDEDEEKDDMKHNVFDNENDNVLCHAAMDTIITDAKRLGSMKESFMQHSEEYGIDNIEYLFPEAQRIDNGAPEFIKKTPDAWVDITMRGVKHSPFSRIKSLFADITADDARAKGYMKGNLKKEEVFGLLKRTTTPTTIYKKQKLDRDDVIDITDFDVVAWLKGEMRTMLDEEIARAVLFGDGRTPASEDKIDESNIRPVLKDTLNNFYAMETTVTVASGEKEGHAFINAMVKAQDDYQGSGNITLFTSTSAVTDMLLLEDNQGHRLYKTINDLALAMNVNQIVKVPASIIPDGYYGVALDLRDYNIGADKGGAINMFDDFDIDYNQMKYLIETRCSGALTKYHSAIVLKKA